MHLNRVVITGRGSVSPYGLGVKTLIDNCWAGQSGVRAMDEWRMIKGLGSYIAAPVPFFDVKKYLPRVARRTMGDMAVYATLASREAVQDAKFSDELLAANDIGIAMGSTTGSPAEYDRLYREFLHGQSIDSIKSGMFFKIMGHSCAANVMYTLGIRGEQWAPTSACTSSAQAIGLGYLLIRQGRQRAVICGGADEVHHSVTMIFDIIRAASHDNDNPACTPRPFDSSRDGVVCGGGSGVLILESLDSALSRGAHIYGEITGFGHAGDPGHIANPSAGAMAGVMGAALQEAELSVKDVDYINAHATGTEQGDIAEANAISSMAASNVPVSSLKGHLGHTLGASGAMESILVLEMMQRGELLPTLNLEQVDPECGDINLINNSMTCPVKTVLKNNFALGGVNVAIVYQQWGGE